MKNIRSIIESVENIIFYFIKKLGGIYLWQVVEFVKVAERNPVLFVEALAKILVQATHVVIAMAQVLSHVPIAVVAEKIHTTKAYLRMALIAETSRCQRLVVSTL